MLIIFFGVSCVGKSTLIQELRERFGWLSVPTYTTRQLRIGEAEKISVSNIDFIEMEDKDSFVCVNEMFGNKYGTPRREIELAVQTSTAYWMLDFSISRVHSISNYEYLGFIVLPQNEEQLIRQVKSSNRVDRLESILEEYRDYYIEYKDRINSSYIPVINLPDKLDVTSKFIYSQVVSFHL